MVFNDIFLWLFTGFDEGELSEDGPNDVEGLDSSIAHIANLLSTEPSDGNFATHPKSHFHVISYIGFNSLKLCNSEIFLFFR